MTRLSSNFAIIPVFLALLITLMAPFLMYMSVNSPAAGLLLPTLYVLFMVYFWLTEFRTRAHFVLIEKHRISIKEYFGLGRVKIFRYSEFEGFITSHQPGRFGSKEYIFLIGQGKRQVCISEFYHRNFFDLKKEIQDRNHFLGEKDYKWSYEYKQMFK